MILRLCLVNGGSVFIAHYSIFLSACYIFIGSPLCCNHCCSAVLLSRLRPLISLLYQGIAGSFFTVLVFSGAWCGVVLCCLVSMSNVSSLQVDSVILDAILKFLNVNLFVFPIRYGFHDCGRLLGIQLANYKCVIRYVVVCDWLIQCNIITHQGNENIERVSISVSCHIHVLM